MSLLSIIRSAETGEISSVDFVYENRYAVLMIKAVIFDYGNVISAQQTSGVQREMEKLTGVPASLFASVYKTYRFDYDRGSITGAQMYAMQLKDAGYEALSANTALMQKIAYIDISSWRRLNSDVVNWSLSLKKQGYKLGILSNMPHEFLAAYESEIPPFVEADYACFSCRVKLIKPEEAIYEDALRGLGVAPHEAVFFDDVKENINAANKLRLNGVLWTGLEEAKRALKEICSAK
jgi:putative hydrolase of the HAD superfamily